MRFLFSAAVLAAAALTPSSVSAASFVFNITGVISSLEGGGSKLKVGDALSATINVATTTGDIEPENNKGFYYIVEAAGTESVGVTSGVIETGIQPQAGLSSFDIYVGSEIHSALRFLRPSEEIFFNSVGNMRDELYFDAIGPGNNLNSDVLSGLTASSAGFSYSTLSQYLTADNGQNVKVGYSNVQWSVVPPGAAVPEPSTWAMLILGFGVIGTFMRRARRFNRAII